VLGRSNPRMNREAKGSHVGNNSGFDKRIIRKSNSFAPFLGQIKCYKCGKFGCKEASYKYEEKKHAS